MNYIIHNLIPGDDGYKEAQAYNKAVGEYKALKAQRLNLPLAEKLKLFGEAMTKVKMAHESVMRGF